VLTVELTVDRVWQYYVYNLVVPISFLSAIGCQVFFIPPKSIDARLAMTLTVFLALVAFQLIITGELPNSTEMNRVHVFVLLTGTLFVCIAIECVAAYTVASGALNAMMRGGARSTSKHSSERARVELAETSHGTDTKHKDGNADKGQSTATSRSLSAVEKGTVQLISPSRKTKMSASSSLLPSLLIDRVSLVVFPTIYLVMTISLLA